jgi:LuxR family maltose regulon positive regulatory protein
LAAHITLARLYLVLGRREHISGAFEKARSILENILPVCQDMGGYGSLMEGLVLLAQVADSSGDGQLAQDCLHRALDLGEPEGPIRVFVDEGEPLMRLLDERRSLVLPDTERDYLEKLMTAWVEEKEPVNPARPARTELLVEPLSFRELEVLRWMAEGKSNQEIAEGLVLSLNTVKKHVSAIMGKLDAKNRSRAVITARELGLLN